MKTNLVFSFGLALLLSACGAPHGPGVGLAPEARPDVFHYAWFTGRWPNDVHFTSLLGSSGQPTELGRYYLSLPYGYGGGSSACGGTNVAQGRPAASAPGPPLTRPRAAPAAPRRWRSAAPGATYGSPPSAVPVTDTPYSHSGVRRELACRAARAGCHRLLLRAATQREPETLEEGNPRSSFPRYRPDVNYS